MRKISFGIAIVIALVYTIPALADDAGVTVDKYKIRSALFMNATDYVGVNSAEDALEAWMQGLEQRNAALQYVVMTKELKLKYAKDLETTFPNWVTGMSSPWVDDYEIIHKDMVQNDSSVFNIKVNTVAVEYAKSYKAAITIVKEDGFFRISKIEADEELSAYTGFIK